jgi:hypothetical protein
MFMTLDEKNEFLRSLNENDFRTLGDSAVAYVREVEFMGKIHYSVHSADGQAMTLAPNMDMAVNSIQSSDMEPVTLH